MSDKETTRLLTVAAVSWLLRQGLAVHEEIGLARWGRRRADLLALSMQGSLTLIEVKASKGDLQRDQKMQGYLGCAERCYLLVPPALLEAARRKIEGTAWGLLTLGDAGWLVCAAKARKQKVQGATRRELITRMAWRAGVSRANTRRRRIWLPDQVNNA